MDGETRKVTDLLTSMTDQADDAGGRLGELLTQLAEHDFDVSAAIASLSDER